MSLQDIARQTHIRLKYLEALENDRRDLIPSAVQGRGFLRLVADLLEIPADPLVEAWDSGVVDLGSLSEDFQQAGSEDMEEARYYEPESIEETNGDEKPRIHEDTGVPAEEIQKEDESAPADAIFVQIGKKLRTQRESLDLSLEDIEHYTHIRKFYLKSIEAGKLDDLPSPVQAKGMIQSYAEFLDINGDVLLLEFADGLQTRRVERLQSTSPEKKKKQQKRSQNPSGFRRLLTPDLLIGSFVILTLVAFTVWSTSRVIARRNQAAQATIPGISEVLAATASQTSSPDAMQTNLQGTPEPGSNLTEPANTPEADNLSIPSSENQVSPTFAMLDNGALQIYIVAQQRTFLRVEVDGVTEFDGRVVPGNAYPFSGDERIELVSGNAAALQILFNQVDLGTIGSYGQVTNLIFEAQGVITPTPRFTNTATPTLQATITLEPTMTPVTPTVTQLIP